MKRPIPSRESRLVPAENFRRWRKRLFGILLVILPFILPLGLLVLAGMSGCDVSFSFHSFGASPQVTITQVTDLGAIRTNPDILGRDGGHSALFQGNSVWLYGDTFIAKADAQNRTLLSDSWSFTADLNAQSGITGFQEKLDSTGAPTMILPETPAEQAFNQGHNINACQAQPCGARWALWPGAIVVNPVDNSALIFYMVVSAHPGSFNFQGVGTSVATWQNLQSQPQRPTLNPPIVADHPDLIFAENEPGFGSAALVSNGTLYVYGCGVPNNSADRGCRLGRVDPRSAQDRNSWMFFAGNGIWSSKLSDAISVFDGGADIVSVSFNSFLQRYVAVYSGEFSQNVMIRAAPNPEGPWSDQTMAFVAMQPSNGNVYDAHAHAEYNVNGGETIFVSYSRATPGPFSSEVRLVSLTLQRPAM